MKIQLGNFDPLEVADEAAIRMAAGIVRTVSMQRAQISDMAYTADDLEEIADDIDGTAERAAQVEELARDLFHTGDNDVWLAQQWPNSLFADQLREAARNLLDKGWRKGEAGAA